MKGLLEAPEPTENELLRARVQELEDELEEERQHSKSALAEAQNQSRAAKKALAILRSQLQPLFTALRAIFGELDAAGISSENQPQAAGSPRTVQVWESWKQKLPGMPAAFIQAMLDHGEMSAPQLRVAAHCGQQTVYDTVHRLNKLGLINKNGGKFSLKQL